MGPGPSGLDKGRLSGAGERQMGSGSRPQKAAWKGPARRRSTRSRPTPSAQPLPVGIRKNDPTTPGPLAPRLTLWPNKPPTPPPPSSLTFDWLPPKVPALKALRDQWEEGAELTGFSCKTIRSVTCFSNSSPWLMVVGDINHFHSSPLPTLPRTAGKF